MIKKILAIILSSLFIFTMACSKNHEKKAYEEAEKILYDNKTSVEVANNYMLALASNDLEGMKYLSNKDLAESLNIKKQDDFMNIVGFRVEESGQRGDSGLYKYTVCKSKEKSPNATLEEYSLVVNKVDNEYKVEKVIASPKYSAFYKDKNIKIRFEDEVKINTLINLDSILDTAYSKQNKGDISQVSVPKAEFGVLSFNFSGEKVALSTKDDKNSYVGIIEIDDSQKTMNVEEQENLQEKSSDDKDKIVGKKLTTLDIYDNCEIKKIQFTKDDSHVAVTYNINGVDRFKFYKTSGDIIPLTLEDTFTEDTYSLIFKSYQDDEILFNVEGVKESNKVRQDLLGSYKISLKDFKLTKI
ncbi:hypothetical protein [Clostridium tarantellae]|uniref:Lipoprotein n=1 Tax=Clostridium tarantellae TaxID=39493 RepID=A0A6I1ML33_9CLOT|nr:hypothetical protein [Clostridium tarantellae]MPQ43453.1 hypothetical protein [Clostridium tarantellae]